MSVFDDIVVVWNYTYPHYDSIPFLSQLYGFPHVAHYGPPGPGSAQVIGLETDYGFTSYAIFQDAFRRFPDARGILVVHDDFMLNRIQFEELDGDKVWFQPWRNPNTLDKWYWWNRDVGAIALHRAAAECGQMCANVQFGYSDLMYIPTSLAVRLLQKLAIYAEHKVFCELAWPNIVNAYVGASERQGLRTVNHVLFEHGHCDWQKLYDPRLHGIHPVKWSIKVNRAAAASILCKPSGAC